MSTHGRDGLPARLVSLRRRFERWRGTREVRSRIPEPLWIAAGKLAGTYGLHRTAKALRVNYYALKKRVEEKAAASSIDPCIANARGRSPDCGTEPNIDYAGINHNVPRGDAATFLEWGAAAPTPSISADSCECTLELEDTDGAKMRLHLRGVAAPDLIALSRSFYQGES